MKNRKGFTLIEILSVVIIIGILGIIGIVAISSYVENSKQSSFVNIAKVYLDNAKAMKAADKLFHDPKNTEAVLIPLSEIEMEKGMTATPYGEIDFDNSYVVIVNVKGKYHYYITLRDETGHAFILENVNTLSTEKIVASENGTGIHSVTNLRNPANDLTLLIGEVKYELSDKNLYDEHGSVKTSTILLDNSILGEFSVDWDYGVWTNEDKIITVETYDESMTYKYYISTRSQKPLASDSGWTDNNVFSKDLGTYYVFVKDSNGEVSDPEEVEIIRIDREKPNCTLKVSGTQSAHGIYNSSVTVKIDVSNNEHDEFTKSKVINYGIGGLDAGDSVTDPATGVKTTVYTGYVEDEAGNLNTCSVTVKTDGTAPTVSYSLAEGIYNTSKNVVITPSDGTGEIDYYNVRVTKDGTEILNQSRITTPTYNVNLNSDGKYVIYTKVLDTAGNWLDNNADSVDNGEYNKTYMIDTTKPTCTLDVSGGEYSTGTYYGSDVNINFGTTNDSAPSGTSYKSGIKRYGIGSVTGNKTAILSTDSEGTTYTGYIEDNAGNTNQCSITVKRKANFTITYHVNGGSACPNSTKTVVYGSAYGVLCSPGKTGYSFGGWYRETALSNKVTATTTFKNETADLYAKWVANSYTVTLDANGGSVSPGSIDVNYDGTYANLPNATRNGYTFNGWYTAKTGGERVYTTTPVTNTANHTLYAHWTPNTYTINFSGNGNTGGTTSAKVCNYGSACTLTSNGFNRSSYAFVGWATSSSGSVVYTNGQSVTDLGTTTLYAVWVPALYDYSYTNGVQTFTAQYTGTYTLEVWGAQGGTAGSYAGGKGGYSSGNIYLTAGTKLYIYVGGKGVSGHPSSKRSGGYNGGGSVSSSSDNPGNRTVASGGGATHIATVDRGVLKNYASYTSEVLIVAGGGGGGYVHSTSGHYGPGGTGGGSTGGHASNIGPNSGCYGKGGTQSAGGKNSCNSTNAGSFGQGGSVGDPSHGSAGGGGWYGGGGSRGDRSGSGNSGGGGGSGYTGGVTNATTSNGSRPGHGAARITFQG